MVSSFEKIPASPNESMLSSIPRRGISFVLLLRLAFGN